MLVLDCLQGYLAKNTSAIHDHVYSNALATVSMLAICCWKLLAWHMARKTVNGCIHVYCHARQNSTQCNLVRKLLVGTKTARHVTDKLIYTAMPMHAARVCWNRNHAWSRP